MILLFVNVINALVRDQLKNQLTRFERVIWMPIERIAYKAYLLIFMTTDKLFQYTPAVLSEIDLVRDNNNDCGEPLNSSGNFSSPGWNTGEPYPANLNCTWQIRHPSKPDCPNSITLTFLDVEERSRGGNCAFDKLVIQSGNLTKDICARPSIPENTAY